MDIIKISNLCAKTTLGNNTFEKQIKTGVTIDISFKIDLNKIAKNDDLENTIDYDLLANDVINWLSNRKTKLLETLANNMLEYLLKNYSITWIKLCVTKIAAINNKCNVSIEIEREQSN